ncbi:hypothetical protein ACERNI_06540 [Camelimonas sp. ID_303_24]
MCSLAGAASLLSTGVGIAGQVMGHNAQKKQAYDQWLHNVKAEAQAEEYRGQLIQYQNDVYQQDIDYGFTYLNYQKGEFDRQVNYLDQSSKIIEKGRTAQYGTLLLRQVEEGIANMMGVDDLNRQARKTQAGADAYAADKGIEGISVDQIIGDVARQQGEAVTVMEMNRSATMRQLGLEMQGVKAQADSSLMNLQMKTYNPTTQIRKPQPVNPVQPSAPVPMPSNGALTAGIAGSLIGGVTNYSKWSGTPMNDLFKIG